MSVDTGRGYVKVTKCRSKVERKKKIAAVERVGLALNWRMDKKTENKQAKQVARSIQAAHLYPMAKILRVITDKETHERTIVFDPKCSHPRIGEVKKWVVIANGDGNEAATVLDAFTCDSKGQTAVVSDECKLSNDKLKGALLFFGPQPVSGELHALLMENVAKFPKTKQSLQLLPDTFSRLQSRCS